MVVSSFSQAKELLDSGALSQEEYTQFLENHRQSARYVFACTGRSISALWSWLLRPKCVLVRLQKIIAHEHYHHDDCGRCRRQQGGRRREFGGTATVIGGGRDGRGG